MIVTCNHMYVFDLKLISFIPYSQGTGQTSLCQMCMEWLYEMLQ